MGVMKGVVIRLGQAERVIVVVLVVMMELESEEGVRVLVVATGVRVRDDSGTGDGRRGEEGRQNGSDDVSAQTHDVGLLPHGYGGLGPVGCACTTRCRAACHLL